MNLGDLLEELRENILNDRSDQIEGAEYHDHLWSTRTLVRYINEAHRKMAREALLIRDGTTPEVTQIQMIEDQKQYVMHPSVFAVLSVRCEHDRADLARAGHASFDTYHMPDAYFFDPAQLAYLPPGKVVAYDTDEFFNQSNHGEMSVMNLRLYPKPKTPYIQKMNLRVLRTPLRKFTHKDLDAYPEIPEDHHLDMLEWAAYLALRIVDVDKGDPERANEFRQSFEAHVAEAKKLAMRKLFTPQEWGFGRNGFSWETN